MSAALQLHDTDAERLAIRPLQPTIGAEITGVDLRRPLSEEDRAAIRAAVLQYKVVFFRGQDLDRAQHEAFARQFGPLYTHPSTKRPEAEARPAVHNIVAESFRSIEQTRIRHDDDVRDSYHTDTSWRLIPAWGAVLRAVTLPDVGGDTIWVDAALAYEGLPDDVKQRLRGLHVTHDYRAALHKVGQDYPIVAHPVVRTHRETG